MASLLNMSGGSLLKKGLPYDYEVEYLETDGYQSIDINIKPSINTSISCLVSTPDNQFNIVGTDNTTSLGIHITAWSARSLAIYFGNIGYVPNQNAYPISSNTLYKIYVDKYNVRVNDAIVANINATKMTGDKLYLFYNNWGPRSYKSRVHYFKIYDNNVLLRDFIPVVKDNIGYMYDKISGTLFCNQNTGSFIVGPRVS